jgi:hypothetical protein
MPHHQVDRPHPNLCLEAFSILSSFSPLLGLTKHKTRVVCEFLRIKTMLRAYFLKVTNNVQISLKKKF